MTVMKKVYRTYVKGSDELKKIDDEVNSLTAAADGGNASAKARIVELTKQREAVKKQDKHGQKVTEAVEMASVHATEAVKNHPEEWSFTDPTAPKARDSAAKVLDDNAEKARAADLEAWNRKHPNATEAERQAYLDKRG